MAAVAQVTATLLERVGSMDAEVNALIDSLRAGAGRLAADLTAVEAGMAELYGAASGPRPRPPRPSPLRPRAGAAQPRLRRARAARRVAAAVASARRGGAGLRADGPAAEAAAAGTADPGRSGRRGRGSRRRPPDRAEHGAQRRVAQRHRALPGRELRAARPAQADRRGLRGDRGLSARASPAGASRRPRSLACVLGSFGWRRPGQRGRRPARAGAPRLSPARRA